LDKLTYAGKLSNLESALPHPNFEFFKGDICNPEIVQELVSKVDSVINFAAESHVDRSIESSTEFVRTNVLGTQVLLDAAVKNKIKKFIQVSTDEVYGSITTGSWSELEPLLPNSPYSASKAAADLLVRSYFVTHNLNMNITRCTNNFGPRQDVEKLIPSFITKLIQDSPVPLYGDGTNIRDWLFVEDHCHGIYKVLTDGLPGEIYNIGGGTELTNLTLAKEMLWHMGKSHELIRYVDDRLGHDRRYSVNFEKILALGYRPKSDFKQSLQTTINWYLDNSQHAEN
jgi:dTDP-glucose 4,6-dehydratase